MITKSYDRKRATWIYDADGHRAIVYKVGNRWVLRAGPAQPPMIAPAAVLVNKYKLRRLADADAFEYLGGDASHADH